MNKNTVEIYVNGPEYRGAPMPKFQKKMVNESAFSDAERYKECNIVFNLYGNSTIEWLSQEEEYHTSAWSEEVKRAFKAHGAKNGHVIDVKFGSRDTGYIEEFELIID